MPRARSVSQPFPNQEYRFHPSQLSGKQRSDHIVRALLAYNEGIIQHNPGGANLKFQKLTQSAFVFMRGTADLMYRDLDGTDADTSTVLCIGDVHVENYGVMETDDGSLVWGLNDFDEANFAPFTWDVKRGATSIMLAATDPTREESFSRKEAAKLARKFAEEYLETIEKSVEKENYSYSFTRKKGPDLIRTLLNKTSQIEERAYLEEKYLDPACDTPTFQHTDEIERIVGQDDVLTTSIQTALSRYLQSLHVHRKPVPNEIKVWDVATKKGSGTGSIGLWRYYALVDVSYPDRTHLMVLEIKQERPSVLEPYVGGGLLVFPSEGSRVAYAEQTHLPNANPFYGYTHIGDTSYLVRKKSPFKARVKLADVTDLKDYGQYVKACGKALALAHLQSDSILMEVYPNVAKAILHSVHSNTFATQMSGFAVKMANQISQDWKYFKQAWHEGHFTFPV